MKSTEAPEDLHKFFATALNSGDLDALVALYAFDGFLMARSGPVRGIRAIRNALAEYVAMKPAIQLRTRKVVQVEDTALLMADWQFHGTARDGGRASTSGTSIEVAHREAAHCHADSEGWRALFHARIRSRFRAWNHSYTVGRPEIRHKNG